MLRNRWFILAVLFVARVTMGFQFQTVGSLSPQLVEGLGIDYAELGTLIGFYMLPGMIIALPGGLLGRQFGEKRMVVLGFGLMAVGGALMALTDTYAGMSAGRILSGVGAVLMNVLTAKMLADWFTGPQLVTAMSVMITSWPVGLSIGLIAFAPLAGAMGPESVFWAGSLAGAASFILLAIGYRDPPDLVQAGGGGISLNFNAREWVLVSLAGATWAVYNVGFISVISFGPDLFVERGFSPVEAGFAISLASWLLIPMVPLGGYIAAKSGRPTLFMVVTFILGGIGFVYLPMTDWPLVVVVLTGAVVAMPAGSIMALPVEALRPDNRGPGMGLYFTYFYIGMAVLPGVAGWTRDVTQDTASPIYFAALMIVCALMFLGLFRLIARRH